MLERENYVAVHIKSSKIWYYLILFIYEGYSTERYNVRTYLH